MLVSIENILACTQERNGLLMLQQTSIEKWESKYEATPYPVGAFTIIGNYACFLNCKKLVLGHRR